MTVERWTDVMLDELASSVGELREGLTEVRVSVTELREGLTEVRESITELRESVTEVREGLTELRESVTELREGLTDVKDSVDGLRITAQALLQVAAQNQSRMDRFEEEMTLMKQRQAESDQRFNTLLEEVRDLIRGNHGDN
ncbi:hypothetical protein LC593_02485 [Nostoc sp. CHAB 5844]|nr:hypothetical protein [Nostoc sp. CHAB 5844]